jgi:hypothetical protein
LIHRLARAAANIFSRPAFYWALAAAFWLRVAILTVLTPRRFDAEGMWEGAHAYLTDPSHMYDAAAQYLAQFHIIREPAPARRARGASRLVAKNDCRPGVDRR